jgi:RND family efflux transporter MFP subunit
MAFLPSINRRSWTPLILAMLSLGCQDEPPLEQVLRPVRAIRIGDITAFTGRTFPGTTAAVDTAEMSFRVGGPLVEFPGNQLGKAVQKGELLAQIDPRDFELQLRDAQAALAKAESELDAMRQARPEEIEKLKAELARTEASSLFSKAEYERWLKLEGTRAASVSDVQLAEAKAKLGHAEVLAAKEALRIGEKGARPEDIKAKEAQIASFQAAVQSALDQLSDTKLTAPFDGAVSTVYVKNFEVVQPNQKIIRVVNATELEIRVDIPENLIALVPQVSETYVTIQAYPDLQIPARIAEIGAEASSVTRTYPVKLRFKPPSEVNVRPGMTGIVSGRGDPAAVISSPGHVVPATAVYDDGEKRLVWIYDSSAKTVRSREVKVLGTTPLGLNVSGVEPGEWVVTAGAHYLEENQPVRLLSDEPEGDGEV